MKQCRLFEKTQFVHMGVNVLSDFARQQQVESICYPCMVDVRNGFVHDSRRQSLRSFGISGHLLEFIYRDIIET
ncbi:MAG: hypothetical protein K8F91_10725, partial [Candidatus Obscuribacterales bacterium]|nr:hypothetical protein [Candidatus Obscuribacterales bacterium]